ncbi:deoxyribodipyrimidine photo-lyase [Vibrio sp. SM6]|uniref:Deoxyribodipyrimidine photo-lyase n=1 Tax=Vibrio agarilyticus TaxID=2726741 RepID=A0A7X8TNI2_9VIBR|nr:deoxyribodipyrimidine photo-lyase [Vibrio agarilyticus]NLS11761.1 deoxyribodipyrimidine photo-lyase [Vibrio agarilyticus]
MNLVWFRRDLRITDNSALNAAMRTGAPTVALFIATPKQWQQHDLAPIQSDFIVRRLVELNKDLADLNVPLLYLQCDDYVKAAEAVAELAQHIGASALYANQDYEVNEKRRDREVETRLDRLGIESHWLDDKCILPPGSVRNQQGEYFKVFTPFKRSWLKQMMPPVIIAPEPQSLVPSKASWPYFDPQHFVWDHPRQCSKDWFADDRQINAQLQRFCQHRVENYDSERDFPARDGTSGLSAYLAIGALSSRQCLAALFEYRQKNWNEGTQVWLSEIVWREFYQHLMYFEPKLAKGEGFVPWESNIEWYYDDASLRLWQQGATGYPIVDAAMRQLNQTGWMHNRLRMIVASFLTKDLHLDWRCGERYFMSRLIDGDFASNNGGWQWCASTGCDGQPYFRIFNPISQGERFDPDGAFVRHWVPELTKVPNRYIHKPWLWADFEQLDYPSPMVEHKREREITLAAFKLAKG